ncbi:magnesium transporter CorA [Xylophilus rhododendri]|uniref:Magnesium transporter CorA n=1 Tax=Xylophilus rhododendri TaxID=2697032 RepID=A0A857J5G6_9BURK|nr:magnesium transporter CorA family protein [Xylophilus rhododendri]QHI99066.1 magnesium transporter CorA [Xylophilus rhododendri]
MRVISLQGAHVVESDSLDAPLPPQGFLWISCTRKELEAMLGRIQEALQRLIGIQLVDLHVSDLLNRQLPSHYDYTSQYDLLVFRRLVATNRDGKGNPERRDEPMSLRQVDTTPVGFAVFDQLLLTVHPDDCTVRDAFAARLLAGHATEVRATGARTPASPADLMLRLVNLMVDGYLELRRELTRQLDVWQTELLRPRPHVNDWSALLGARLALHHLDEICEDQRAAVQDWVDALETWPAPQNPPAQRERDLLMVRSRDVLEHIERVVHHVRRLEQSAETAVQMHFSIQSNRANDIMRVLTTLTAVFLPLNLIAGIFGMNFEFIPLVHKQDGFWWAMGSMGAIAIALMAWFWRKKYLARPSR